MDHFILQSRFDTTSGPPLRALDLDSWLRIPGRILAQHRTGSTVLLAAESTPLGLPLVRKSYLYPTPRDRTRGFFRNTFAAKSRVAQEFANLERLGRERVNPPLAVGYAERRSSRGVLYESFLLTAYLPAKNLEKALIIDPRSELKKILSHLGRFVARLHRTGYVDRDLHLRNLMLRTDHTLFKIDCPRGSFPPRSFRTLAQRRDLRDLGRDLSRSLGPAAWEQVKRVYDLTRLELRFDPGVPEY